VQLTVMTPCGSGGKLAPLQEGCPVSPLSEIMNDRAAGSAATYHQDVFACHVLIPFV
jgi:hypothetical protein